MRPGPAAEAVRASVIASAPSAATARLLRPVFTQCDIRPRHALGVGRQRRVVGEMLRRVLAHDVDDRRAGLAGIVQVGEAVGEAGPRCSSVRPGRPVMRAQPSAAPVATPSNRQSTQDMPSTRSSAATKCISDVPGFEKQTSAPPATRVRTRLSAPFIVEFSKVMGGVAGSSVGRAASVSGRGSQTLPALRGQAPRLSRSPAPARS